MEEDEYEVEEEVIEVEGEEEEADKVVTKWGTFQSLAVEP